MGPQVDRHLASFGLQLPELPFEQVGLGRARVALNADSQWPGQAAHLPKAQNASAGGIAIGRLQASRDGSLGIEYHRRRWSLSFGEPPKRGQ